MTTSCHGRLEEMVLRRDSTHGQKIRVDLTTLKKTHIAPSLRALDAIDLCAFASASMPSRGVVMLERMGVNLVMVIREMAK
jgi:hypothetical protein